MAKKDRYEELAAGILDLVGGKDNVAFFTHCVTRLRFNLKDKSLVKKEEIEKISSVMGCQWSGDQLQIIIGQAVGDAYQLICEKTGLAAQETVNENLDGPGKKFSPNMILESIAGCITPLLPLLMAGGFIKIVVILGEQLHLLASGNPTHTVLSFVGDAAFYFLPIFVGASAAKKFGANTSLGMMVGALFIHPNFIAALATGPLSVFGIPIYNASYTSSIFPALLSVAVMAPIEKFIAKHSPDSIRSITEPFLTMLIMIPLALCLLGPIGAFLGQFISEAIIWLYETVGFVGVAVFAGLCPLLVMTGMHASLMPYLMNSFALLGWEPIVLTGMIISNINQGVACLAVAIRSKDANLKATAAGGAVTAMVGGVTEPAMYGVNLKLKTPLYGAMIGSTIGGAVAGIGKAVAYSITGSAGLLGGIPVYLQGGMSNVIWMVAGITAGIVATFAATVVLYKEK
jgi:PTS system beta-glucosides-specific IIC component